MNVLNQSVLRRFVLISSLALALPITSHAFQGERPMPGEGRHGSCHGQSERMGGSSSLMHGLKRLQLSEQQKDAVFSLMHGQAPKMREQGKTIREQEKTLAELTKSSAYSDSKAQEMAQQIANTQAQMHLQRIRMERQVLELLTPEQRQELDRRQSSTDQGRKRG